MKGQRLVVIASPGLSAGFALAGVPVFEATTAPTRPDRSIACRTPGTPASFSSTSRSTRTSRKRSARSSTVAAPRRHPGAGPDWTTRDHGPRVHRRDPPARDRLSGEVAMTDARIIRVAGAIAEAQPLGDAALYELVEVGELRLLGEVIRIQGDVATIQVFEETSGLGLDEPVRRTGSSLMTQLGPGLAGLHPRWHRTPASRARGALGRLHGARDDAAHARPGARLVLFANRRAGRERVGRRRAWAASKSAQE